MKNLKTIMFFGVFFIAALSIISCQKTVNVANQDEYYAGSKAGKELAKTDAIKYSKNCSFHASVNVENSNRFLRERLSELGPEYSESYKRGFRWGYGPAFQDYYSIYCPTNQRM